MTRPNQLSALRILLTPAFVATFLSENVSLQYASLGIFFLASLTDWYDGYIARRSGTVTLWGKFLDPLADKILIISALGALWVREYVRGWMVIAIAIRDVVVTALRSYAMFTDRPVNTMYLAKWKTTSQVVAVYVIVGYHLIKHSMTRGIVLWVERAQVIDKMMVVVTFYTVLTGLVYMVENRGHVRSLAVRFFRVIVPLN